MYRREIIIIFSYYFAEIGEKMRAVQEVTNFMNSPFLKNIIA